ncbi:MAG: flavodoxin domain-containing protein [Acutalibacteraceae bacterium]|nr:flavodoxin domain-containing protein [Acutalibacteraceae bacterium]
MKTIVIYNSETGFTKKYAHWIAEKANAECVEFNKAKKMDFESYDAIVFGGWAIAGSISKLKWFKNNISNWSDKKLVTFCVGASPIENPEINATLPKNFTDEELKIVKWFYCPGGLNYEAMSFKSRTMMKMFVKMLNTRKDKTEADLEQIRMLSSSYDISDIKYIEPIIDFLKS